MQDELIWLCCALLDRYVIPPCGYSLLRQEARQEDVRFRENTSDISHIREAGFDLKAATLILLEQGSKIVGESTSELQRKSIDPFMPTVAMDRILADHAVFSMG